MSLRLAVSRALTYLSLLEEELLPKPWSSANRHPRAATAGRGEHLRLPLRLNRWL